MRSVLIGAMAAVVALTLCVGLLQHERAWAQGEAYCYITEVDKEEAYRVLDA